jgi:GH18 family chitinase
MTDQAISGEMKIATLNRDMTDDYNYKEAIKTLRTNLQFCGSNIHTIMFTSALPDKERIAEGVWWRRREKS